MVFLDAASTSDLHCVLELSQQSSYGRVFFLPSDLALINPEPIGTHCDDPQKYRNRFPWLDALFMGQPHHIRQLRNRFHPARRQNSPIRRLQMKPSYHATAMAGGMGILTFRWRPSRSILEHIIVPKMPMSYAKLTGNLSFPVTPCANNLYTRWLRAPDYPGRHQVQRS